MDKPIQQAFQFLYRRIIAFIMVGLMVSNVIAYYFLNKPISQPLFYTCGFIIAIYYFSAILVEIMPNAVHITKMWIEKK